MERVTSNLKVGDWCRFYTNAQRGAGAVTHIGKITRLVHARSDPERVTGYEVKSATETWIVSPASVVGQIEVNESLRVITRDVEVPTE